MNRRSMALAAMLTVLAAPFMPSPRRRAHERPARSQADIDERKAKRAAKLARRAARAGAR